MSKPLTYDWNGHTDMAISYPHLTDFQMAGKVRMLMRYDHDHEGVVMGARDRIMGLSKLADKARALIETLIAALDECEDYFDNRADADCDQDGYIPNEEMKRLATVRDALAAAKKEGFL